jgi:hypothetical protein
MLVTIIAKLPARVLLTLGILSLVVLSGVAPRAQDAYMLIDDFSNPSFISKLGTQWRGVSDQVMGGVSEVAVAQNVNADRFFLRLSGDVRLENNGGFIQAALDLASAGGSVDASGFEGVRLVVRGNGEQYSVHLRTPDNARPWQSYRAYFTAEPDLKTVDIPFSAFTPYRIDAPLDVRRLRRIGLVAIGRAFRADLSVSEVGFYR